MKVSYLEGPMLDYWVALAIGVIVRPGLPRAMSYDVPFDIGPSDTDHGDHFEPSARWGHGGPLIEEHGICVTPNRGQWYASVLSDSGMIFDPDVGGVDGIGPTPLIAAMRALVARKFGEEVSDEPTS